jgi:hypothetical protein
MHHLTQDVPHQSDDPTDLVVVFVHVVGQEISVVSYPTDLPSGYKTGPECQKNSKCTYVYVCVE